MYSQTSIYVLLSLRTFDLCTILFLTNYSMNVLEFDIGTLSTLTKVRISNLST